MENGWHGKGSGWREVYWGLLQQYSKETIVVAPSVVAVDGKANKYEELFEGKANVIFFVGFHIWRLGDKKRKKPRSVSRFQERNYGINWDGENLY